MRSYYFLLTVVYLQILVQCFIPSLVVKKLDKTLIARKRQDTMDMCRIFTEENKKSHNNHAPKIIKSYRPNYNLPITNNIRHKRNIYDEIPKKRDNLRYKRGVPINDGHIKEKIRKKRGVANDDNQENKSATMKYAVNPALNPEDVRRVESIVDKLYDDLEEKGQKVTYRQVQTTSTVKVHKNKTILPSRRFDFAPSMLTGPQEPLKKAIIPADQPFDSRAKWKHGIVPYFVDFNTYDAHLTEDIMKAFDYFEKATCIRLQRLREKPTDKKSLETVPWLYISNPTGIRQCVHSNEKRRINGVQMTVFGYDCMSLGDIVHEVMHILGYSHEHLRSDRDEHISVIWDNIKPGYKKYFDINTRGTDYDLESLPYDYTSILHYPQRAFSKNGKSTILTEAGIKIGQREGLSEIDVEKVALIYSNECVSRNREYLLQTCPSVVKAVTQPTNISQQEIDDYFRERLWPFGIINYRFRDKMEFTVEERENIAAVFRHIEQETCLQFSDVAANDDDDNDNNNNESNTTPEPEDDTTSPEVETTQTDAVSSPEKEVVTSAPVTNASETTLAPLDNNISSDNDTEINDSRVAEIIITKPKKQSSVNKMSALRKPGVLARKDFRENEIDNEISGAGIKKNQRSMSKKRQRLRKALADKHKLKRYRRDTESIPPGTRRHANAILILKRSPSTSCDCPLPGSPNGDQVLEIGAGCFNSVNDLLHFFVHLLGLDHQHNMHDRDNYLHIVWENIAPDIHQEMKTKLPPAASAGFSYDYQSVMHYPWLQIKNGKTNIMYPIWNDGWAMGHWQGLSSIDVQKLNLLYFKQCLDRQKQEQH